MFTKKNTYNEIMECDRSEEIKMLIGTLMFSNDSILSLVPNSAHDKTFQEIEETVQTPWGMPFPSQEIVDAANLSNEIFRENKWKIHTLWEADQEPVYNNTKADVCLFTPILPDDKKRPAVIICPGGAYTTLAMVSEGFGMARLFMERGYRPYILRYRRKPNRFPSQQEDLTLALLYVIANAKRDGIDASNLMIMGFSAGGHLCASTVPHIEEMKAKVLQELSDQQRISEYEKINPMPKKMVLGYAATMFDQNLMDGLCSNSEENEYYTPYHNISKFLPKTFAWACEDDPLVPCEHTSLWAKTFIKEGGTCCYQLFPTGGHGIADGSGTSADGWVEHMFSYMEEK